MSAKLSPDWLAWPQTVRLIQAFAEGRAPMRFVGGSVRDALLGKPVQDVDAATSLVPQAAMALLEKAGIKAIPTGIDHGTVTAVIHDKSFEITTLRKDVATDGRHAQVAYTDDWKEDAARRDFTINALYLSPSGELFDYFGGVTDLRAGRVRFIGAPEQRISEDYLRTLRFFRFYAWYGKGEADQEALKACAAAAKHIETLSGERIRQEMLKLLAAPGPIQALTLMQEYKISPYVFGGGIDGGRLIPVLELEKEIAFPPQPLVRLSALLGSDAKQIDWISTRWRLSNDETAQLEKTARYYIAPDMPLAEQKKLLHTLGSRAFKNIAMASAPRAFLCESYKKIIHLPEQFPPQPLPISGDDLITIGIKPGKEMGDLLRRLDDEWLKSDYTLTKEQLLEMAKQAL